MKGLTQYYLAASLDGFIAEPDGGLDRLEAFDASESDYAEFFAGVGAIAIGARTYEIILAKHEWLYGSVPAWVFAHREYPLPSSAEADVRFVQGSVRDAHAEMRRAAGDENVWVLGGGNLAAQFVETSLVDELLLTLVPVILGAGIPFLPLRLIARLQLRGTRAFANGMVQLAYDVR